MVTLALEAALFFGGLFLYLRATDSSSNLGRYGMLGFGLAAFGLQTTALFAPPPPSETVMALMGMSLYIVFAGIVYWLEKKRT